MCRSRLCARGVGATISHDGGGEFRGNLREGTAWLGNGPIGLLGLIGRGDFIDATVGHGIAARAAARQGIELIGTIAVLFGGIVEKTTTALKVFGVVLGAAGVDIAAKKSLRHSEFRDKRIGDGFAIRNGAACDKHITGFARNVFSRRAPFI